MLVFFVQLLLAQTTTIPNASFENWDATEPASWHTNNDSDFARYPVTHSNTAYHGSSAIKLEIINYNESAWGAFVTSDTFSVISLDANPLELSGYYRYTPVADAVCIVNVTVFREFSPYPLPVGFGIDTLAAAAEYRRFTIPIIYANPPPETVITASINLKVHAQYPYQQGFGATALFDSLNLSTSITDIAIPDVNVVKEFKLMQNFPNPFNPSTKIKFNIPVSEIVTIDVYNTLGQKILTLLNSKINVGSHTVEFNVDNLPSGVYFYSLKAGDYLDVKKMILLK
jgi:hypothetical protein